VKKLWLAVLLSASCAGEGTMQENVREAFEEWRAALLAGDAEKTYEMMSEGLKAGWLFERLTSEDRESVEFRRALTGAPRTDLDLWLEYNRKNPSQRAAVLPPSVSAHPNLRELYRRYFMQELASVRQQFSGLRVAEVYADQTGASIAVKTPDGTTDLFQMVSEGAGWKIDLHRRSIRSMRR
jgi:hypothetical protein